MSWTHFGDKVVKARKAASCYLCGEPIAIGETYVRRTGVGECGIGTTKMHPECEKESDSWHEMDWECFFEGDMERPRMEGLSE